ncbi:MAG: glycosyltransferase family 2 protein [Thermodesulfobacteriota bacterium]
MERVAAVVVCHNSAAVIDRCLNDLNSQSRPVDEIVVVDSGSTDTNYLQRLEDRDNIRLLRRKNIGFAQANNEAVACLLQPADVVVFVNPDAFLSPDTVAIGLSRLKNRPELAVVSGRLLGWDLEKNCPGGRIDSAGIFRKWYGRWYDRGQGEIDRGQYETRCDVPALCGALMICRSEALARFDGVIFDSDFFLYKEDIELSLRLRKYGWSLEYDPGITAYHCRGWQRNRKKIDQQLKLHAAESELLLYKKHPSPYMAWALFKWLLVRLFHI